MYLPWKALWTFPWHPKQGPHETLRTTLRPPKPLSWHHTGHEPHSGVHHQTQQYQCSPRNASQIWAQLDFPTPDKSQPWPQCDGLIVPVPLSLLPYSTFFNPMNLMGLGRGAKDIINLSFPPVKHPLMLTHLPTNHASTPPFECWYPSYQPSRN